MQARGLEGEIAFTGERFVPGKAPERSSEDHFARYEFACRFAREKRVLDIACGVGYGSAMLRRSGAGWVDGVDIASDSIRHAIEAYGQPGIRFTTGDVTSFRAAHKYDLIVCFETLEHIPAYEAALVNLRSLLEPDGRLIVSSPNRLITSPRTRSLTDKPRNPFHCQEFTVEELRVCLHAAGLVVVPPIYGQRHQRYFRKRLLKNLYRSLLRPGVRFSPQVTPLRPGRQPRFIVAVCRPG